MEHATWTTAILILFLSGAILTRIASARRGRTIFVRRIPGLDHLDDSLGRATDMGRPILFSPGFGELSQAIEPDDTAGEPPLIPVLSRYQPWGSSRSVNFKTKRPCHWTMKSHVNQVVLDTERWEASAAFRLEQSRYVECYVRNDHLGFVIPYEFQGVTHSFEPDFLVRLTDKRMLIVEVKGYEDEQTRAKHQAAKRWVGAVNRAGSLGHWRFVVCKDPQMLERSVEFYCREEW